MQPPLPVPVAQEGSRILGLSGWIRDTHDSRDRMYSSVKPRLNALPTKTNNRANYRVPLLDQGNAGSCGAQAAAEDLGYDLWYGVDPSKIDPGLIPSRNFIYYNTRALMGTLNQDSGVQNRLLCQAIIKQGWCDERLHPYRDNGWLEKPSPAAYAQAASRLLPSGQALRIDQTLDAMKSALANGDTFIFGFTVYASFESASTLASGIVPVPAANERVLGGHDIIFVDFDDSLYSGLGGFIFRNSWGNHFGVEGWGQFPYPYALDRRKAGDFWTLVWDRPAPPLPPVPPIPPIPPSPGGPYVIASQADDGSEIILHRSAPQSMRLVV